MLRVDSPSMNCTQIRQAISARIDGDPLGMDERALDAHLSALAVGSANSEAHRVTDFAGLVVVGPLSRSVTRPVQLA